MITILLIVAVLIIFVLVLAPFGKHVPFSLLVIVPALLFGFTVANIQNPDIVFTGGLIASLFAFPFTFIGAIIVKLVSNKPSKQQLLKQQESERNQALVKRIMSLPDSRFD